MKNKLVIKGKDKNIEYDILFTFERDKQTYIVYTDNVLDEEGFVKTYASIYDSTPGKKSLINIEDDEDFELIEELLDKLDRSNEEK